MSDSVGAGAVAFDIAGRIRIADVARAAKGPLPVHLDADARHRMAIARAVVDEHMMAGTPVYGLNTGLGGNVGHRIELDEIPAFQEQMVRGRIAGVGEPLPIEACRATLFCRAAALTRGGAGISPHVHELMLAMMEHDVVPVLPSRGSLGTGDLVVLMSVAHTLVGRGHAWHGGTLKEAADALADAGLEPITLGAKDGLAIANASAMTCAMAALSLEAVRETLSAHIAVAALAIEGYGANPGIFDPRLAAARPAGAQVQAAALFRRALEGSRLYEPRAEGLVQDALSFRTLSQVTGSTLAAYALAAEEVEIELDATSDNPLVMSDGAEIRSTANFQTPAIALAFDTLAIAMTHVATASAHRSIKLMTGRLSGLPNYLSPVGGASAGFVPLQKSIAALQAEIRLKAQPASLDALAVSDTVEDVAALSPLCIRKLDEQTVLVRWIVAIEALLAAQACGLRHGGSVSTALGAMGRVLHPALRSVVPALHDDRETGPDVAAVREWLFDPVTLGELDAILERTPSPLSAGQRSAGASSEIRHHRPRPETPEGDRS